MPEAFSKKSCESQLKLLNFFSLGEVNILEHEDWGHLQYQPRYSRSSIRIRIKMHFLFSIRQELPTHSCPSIRVKESREDSKPHIILPHFKVAFFSIREFLVEIFWVRKKWVAIPLFHHHTTVKICNEFRQDWDSNDHSFWISTFSNNGLESDVVPYFTRLRILIIGLS